MASKKHVFSQFEKKVFISILKSYTAIVESKNTDSSTLRQKNVAWDNITREYNASPHVTTKVSNKQLRRLWMNQKQRQRDALAKRRQQLMAIAPSTSSEDVKPDVAQLARSLMVEIPAETDMDTIYSGTSLIPQDMEYRLESRLEITPPITSRTQADATLPNSIQPANSLHHKHSIVKEYKEKCSRAGEIHTLEMELLRYKIREAKAKAELAEFILQRERAREGTG